MALVLASLRDAVLRGIRFRWCRFAQPPATGWEAAGFLSGKVGHFGLGLVLSMECIISNLEG